jgi:hypothetical protein
MNSIEEKLWSYIDGSCTAQEQQAIAMLIAKDEVYMRKYHELLKLNEEFTSMELDEPSMAFTYNVMETIRTQHAQQPLKAAINKRIILGIAIFFIVTIAALVMFALSSVNWHTADTSIKIPEQLNVNHINSFFTGPVIKGFLFFDVVMVLFLLDTYLRRRSVLKHE